MKKLFEELKERGFVYQSTHEEKIEKLINEEKITFYLGIDPTADSLHIGHFFALMMFKRLQERGHKGILVIGGATALIGDPTGRSDMRTMLSKEDAKRNIEEVKKLASRFIDVDGENPAIILNNDDWISKMSYIDFLRLVGTHFNINTMLATDVYGNRMENGGLTYLEMGYMPMQAYDFVYLKEHYNCLLQIGGSDQWANIIAGSTLNHKMSVYNNVEEEEIYGLTAPLLMTKEGKKMGKSSKGTLWVAREKTTVFDFYQYFYNVDDQDVEMLLKFFTYIDSKEIENVVKNDILAAKRTMAYEITKLVHGKIEADKVVETLKTLYSNDSNNLENVPNFELSKSSFEKDLNIVDLCVESNFLTSKSEAIRLIKQNGLSLNDEKVVDTHYILTKKDLVEDSYLLLKKGKKTFLKVSFK